MRLLAGLETFEHDEVHVIAEAWLVGSFARAGDLSAVSGVL